MKVMITGPQGSGKTTQARILADKLGYCFIGMGDMLRQLAEEDNELGKDVREDLSNGHLVDDNLAARLIKEKMITPECRNGFVTDGYPRTFSQHQLFDPQFDKVFYLKVSNSEAENRLLGRGRADDSVELIRKRLSWYYKETQPLLDYYEKSGKLVIIDGEQPIDRITDEIESILRAEIDNE